MLRKPTRKKKTQAGKRKEVYVPSKEAVDKRKELEAEFDLSDSVAQLLLDQIQKAIDRREEARRQLAKEGITTTGRYGQRVMHPAVRVERSAADLVIATLRALNVEYQPAKSR